MVKKFDRSLLPPAPNFQFEIEYWGMGLRYIAGIDEAGRGALAGPVAAAAIVFPPDEGLAHQLQGVRDSKQMTPSEREEWAERLPDIALAHGVGFASPEEIDDLGIVPATRLAMTRAVRLLKLTPQYLLIDYVQLSDFDIPQQSLVKGDMRSLSIAAASILAKTARDARMRELDAVFPGYDFFSNKGYGTLAHRTALENIGPSRIHRKSFRGVMREGEQELISTKTN